MTASAWQPNKLEAERLDKVAQIEAQGIPSPAVSNGPTPAPLPSPPLKPPKPRMLKLAEAQDAEAAQQLAVTVCGRIRRVNVKGKLSFMHIEDESGRIQLFLRVNDMAEATYNLVKDKLVDSDDFVQATGTLMRTKAGEVSVLVKDFVLLAKSLSPLPVIKQQVKDDGTVVEYGEFTDVEARYRQRYADLAVCRSGRQP